jgi:hypothetical protein
LPSAASRIFPRSPDDRIRAAAAGQNAYPARYFAAASVAAKSARFVCVCRINQHINRHLTVFPSIFNIIERVSFPGAEALGATLQDARISPSIWPHLYSFPASTANGVVMAAGRWA